MLNKYTGIFDITYTERQSFWISQRHQNINTFDCIELLTIHSYDNSIAEKKDERSMNGLQLIGFKEQHLHSMQDYLNALQIILNVSEKTKHLEKQVAPIVADWPGQIYLRTAISCYLCNCNSSNIINNILSFLPMISPLHISLNS